MTAAEKTTAAPAVHIEQLRLVTDRALGHEQQQSLGQRFAGALDAALVQAGSRARLSIGELVLEAGADQLADHRGLSRLATTVAQRILDRAPD